MFTASGALDHPLPPETYFDQHVFDVERERLFYGAWHFACLARDVEKEGRQVAREIAGVPIVVRNEAGSLVGFVNICAHRHSLIVRPGCSRADALRCHYHGWEYNAEGKLKKLPDGPSWKGFDAKSVRLRRLSLDRVGPLVMASLNPEQPPFLTALGDFGEEFSRFYGRHRPVRVWSTEHDVNWKVIAENAVESYHVPSVHPSTFKNYRAPALHSHTLDPRFTRYLDEKPWDNDLQGLAVRALTRLLLKNPTMKRFTQAHVFPAFLLYYSDLASSLIVLEPLGPKRTRHIAISFVPETIRGGAFLRPLQLAFGFAYTQLGERVLREDIRAWPVIQAGFEHSPHAGALCAREERVHAFQRYMRDALDDVLRASPASRQPGDAQADAASETASR